jgi:hypothetical protein
MRDEELVPMNLSAFVSFNASTNSFLAHTLTASASLTPKLVSIALAPCVVGKSPPVTLEKRIPATRWRANEMGFYVAPDEMGFNVAPDEVTTLP